MTPQEKARDLYSKFAGYAHTSHIKKAALLCVIEIVDSWKEDGHKRLDAPVVLYWEQVKAEIQKL